MNFRRGECQAGVGWHPAVVGREFVTPGVEDARRRTQARVVWDLEEISVR